MYDQQPMGPVGGAPSGPTVSPPNAKDLASVLDRNIRTLRQRRLSEERGASAQEKIANAVTRFTGSMAFVYIHLAGFGLWIICNAGLVPGVKPWDPTFVILATEASVEAIFLSTFVLISQNKAAALADKRADLDLQINLLSEHETTRLLTLTLAIAERVGADVPDKQGLAELERDVAPEAVLDRMDETAGDAERE